MIEKTKQYLGINNLRSLVGDTIWTTIASVITVFCNFFLVYLLANLMSPNDFGQFKFITTWLAIAVGFGFSGYNYIIPQLLAIVKANMTQKMGCLSMSSGEKSRTT